MNVITGLQHDDFHNQQPSGLPLSESLLPSRLRDLGYKAHGVGKVRYHTFCLITKLVM